MGDPQSSCDVRWRAPMVALLCALASGCQGSASGNSVSGELGFDAGGSLFISVPGGPRYPPDSGNYPSYFAIRIADRVLTCTLDGGYSEYPYLAVRFVVSPGDGGPGTGAYDINTDRRTVPFDDPFAQGEMFAVGDGGATRIATATGGTLRIATLTTTNAVGTFDVMMQTLDGGSASTPLSGSFDAPVCHL